MSENVIVHRSVIRPSRWVAVVWHEDSRWEFVDADGRVVPDMSDVRFHRTERAARLAAARWLLLGEEAG